MAHKESLLALIACASIIAGCSSKIGSHESAAAGSGPQAVITPIGHKATQSNGTMTLTVRSGADVLLSAKDTVNGSAALTSFAWTQNSSDTPQVNLIYRTSNTVSFTAPTVAQATPINLVLTVKDAHSNSSTAKITVNVSPASDSGQFLTAPVSNATPRSFQVAVVPQANLNLQADAPVCISLNRTIIYKERGSGTTSVDATPVQLAPINKETAWLQASGGAGINESGSLAAAIDSYANPRVSFEVPILNDEDLFVLFNQPQGANRPPAIEPTDVASARIAKQLVPADVDNASLSLTLTATPGHCGTADPNAAQGAALVLSVFGADLTRAQSSAPAASPSLTLSADDLHVALQSPKYFAETKATAQGYYAAIDPIGSAPRAQQTLNAWLDANCFDHTKADYGADTHAAYTNNFDLGFGRDMYFVTCRSDTATRKAGDSASVVINYPSLESAVLKQNSFIAVAMSHNAWSATGSGSERFTKFFTFAPDDRDGIFYLVGSANFDRRGQRYLPGACTVCHGGTVSAATLAGGAGSLPGNLDAAFMPWDEGSLLFSDTDPAYTGTLVPKTGYTRSDQQAALYALNQHAYATYLTDDQTHADRFTAPKALIEKWYGGLAGAPPPTGTLYSGIQFKNQTFSDADTPTTLQTDTNGNEIPGTSWQDENTANQDDLYHKVFAHECRACHTQLYKTVDPTAADRFLSYGSFAKFFATAANGTNAANGEKSIQNLVLQVNAMPLARLTADRLWVDYDGGTSAATLLAKHGANVLGISGLLADGQVITPGSPLVDASVGTDTLSNAVVLTPDRFSQLRADASPSVFVDEFQWSLCLIPAPPPGDAQTLPDASTKCTTPYPLVGASGPAPAFAATQAGIYQLSLTPVSASAQSTATQTYNFNVARKDPIAPSCSFSVATAQTVSLPLNACGGGYTDAPLTTALAITQSDFPNGDVCVNGTAGAWAGGGSCPPVGNGRAISVNLPGGSTVGSVTYTLCDSPDNYCARGVLTITPVTTPQSLDAPYPAHLPLVQAQSLHAAATLPTPAAPFAQNGAKSNGTSVQWVTANDGSLVIHADALPPGGSCSGVATTPAPDSLAGFYHVTPCTDAFTLAFNPTLTGAAGTLHLGGPETITLTPASAKPVCASDGATGTSCAAGSKSVSYTVTDTSVNPNLTSNPAGTIKLSLVQTQSFGGSVTQGNIYSYLTAGCTGGGCHNSGNGAWNLGVNAQAALTSLQSSTCDTVAHNDASGSGTHGDQCLASAGDPPSISSATVSAIYINACVRDHQTATFVGVGSLFNQSDYATGAQYCANLLQWLYEGAQ